MGTLQSEIQKTLNTWNGTPPVAPTASTTQASTGSLTRRVFNYVQDNPSCTSTDVAEGTGLNLGRVSAVLLSLYNKGKLDRKSYPNPNPDAKRDNVFCYWTAVDDFRDVGVARGTKKPKKAKALSKASALIKELDAPKYEMPRMKQVADENPYSSANVILNNMSIQVASDVYKALKEMFK